MTSPTRFLAPALAGLATMASAAVDKVPQATPAGPAQSCVPIVQIDHTVVRSDSVIDFYMRGRQVYRNTLPSGCPELGFERAFSYATSLSQLCSVDIITVLHQGGGGPGGLMRGASCGLGEFQPVTFDKDAAKNASGK